MPLFETLAETLSQLQTLGARTALLGGLAVSAWAEPRFTRDVDLAVAVAAIRSVKPFRTGLAGATYAFQA